jgi:recombination protein RecA
MAKLIKPNISLNHLKNDNFFMFGDDAELLSRVKYWCSTGCWPLDMAIGRGMPGGRIAEVFGSAATGKSLFALYIAAQIQKMGGVACLLDTEMTMSMDIAQMVGVNVQDIMVGYPATVEEVHAHIEKFLEEKAYMDKEAGTLIPAVVIWDSISSTSTDDEIEKTEQAGLGGIQVASQARAMSKMLRIITRKLSKSGTIGLFVNQTREKIGITYGDRVSTSGGKALSFYASVRIKLVELSVYKKGSNTVGVEVKATIVKNKVDRPFGTAKFPILFDKGIDNETACLWHMKDAGLVALSGSWYKFTPEGHDEIKFQAKDWPDVFSKHEDYIHQLITQGEVLRVEELEADDG